VEIKIYCFFGCDWIAAKNLRDAVREHTSTFETMARECLEEFELESEERLNKLVFLDEPCDGGNCSRRTFRQQLNNLIRDGEKFPTMFATSEY